MNYKAKNVLVTGGAGFIGSNFVHNLQNDGEQSQVVTLDRLSTGGDQRNLDGLARAQQHVFVRGDIGDSELVQKLLRKYEIDTIVHFAAESHVDRSITDPLAFVETNVNGTLKLLKAAADYWLDQPNGPGQRLGSMDESVRFHHVSTDEVYGSLTLEDPAFTELTRYDPHSPYAASKASSDHLVRAWRDTYGLPITITNCSNNYGPHQHREKLIPTVIGSCLRHEKIPVYGDGKNRRDWLYVEDHCLGIRRVLEQGIVGETYNLGGEAELPNNDIVQRICALMDELSPWDRNHATLIEFVKDRPGHDWRYAIDITKARRELDWAPTRTMDGGLRETCEWYLAHPEFLG